MVEMKVKERALSSISRVWVFIFVVTSILARLTTPLLVATQSGATLREVLIPNIGQVAFLGTSRWSLQDRLTTLMDMSKLV